MPLLAVISLCFCGSILYAQTQKLKPDHRWNQTELGPIFSASIKSSGKGVKFAQAPKTIGIRIGEAGNAGIGFDTDLLRVVAGWNDGFIRINPGRNALLDHHSARGQAHFHTNEMTGWTSGGKWYSHPTQQGPVPEDQGRYNGLYLHGNRVVMSYQIGQGKVLESPWLIEDHEDRVFTRTFEADSKLAGEQLYLAEGHSGNVEAKKLAGIEVLTRATISSDIIAVAVKGDASLQTTDQRKLVAQISPGQGTRKFQVFLWKGKAERIGIFANIVKEAASPQNLETWTTGGPARWTEILETKGELGKNKGSHTVDTLTPPFQNPWNAILHFGGHDFFSNGDAAICTMEGDVWLVKGIDAELNKLTWQRIATGMYHPLGLRIIDDKIYVLGRDQITRLHDLNGDGEADFYENFSNLGQVSRGSHEFVTSLETDPQGNFYYIKCANRTEHGGSVLKVSKDGRSIERIATGFRNPNGFFVGNNGILTAADQQGTWVPSSRVDIVQKGGFYGYMPMHHQKEQPKTYDGPVTWIPHKVDNSCGGQAWVEGGKWGGLDGQLLHLSYGRCEMFLILKDEFDGVIQGGAVKFPFRFQSGAMRARFNPKDGQLYVSGLQGWQTSGAKDGCFQRVRFTGKPILLPIDLQVHENGILLRFLEKLDQELAEDADSFAIKQWNYRWTSKYGSKHYKLSNPEEIGEDKMEIASATLQPDGKSVFIEVNNLQPVMQMEISYDLESVEGDEMIGKVHNTIHKLRPTLK